MLVLFMPARCLCLTHLCGFCCSAPRGSHGAPLFSTGVPVQGVAAQLVHAVLPRAPHVGKQSKTLVYDCTASSEPKPH